MLRKGTIFYSLGRKKTLVLANVFELGAVLALAWADTFTTFVILRFCIGVGVVGVFMTSYVTGS